MLERAEIIIVTRGIKQRRAKSSSLGRSITTICPAWANRVATAKRTASIVIIIVASARDGFHPSAERVLDIGSQQVKVERVFGIEAGIDGQDTDEWTPCNWIGLD